MSILKNSRQEKFAVLLASGLSATEAYVKAGYSEKGANGHAARLVANGSVAARFAELQAELTEAAQKATALTKEWVLNGLRANFERAMQAVAVVDRTGNETGEYNYQGNVANRALELIGKELGMFKDRVELGGEGGGPVVLKVVYGERIPDTPATTA